MNGYYYRPAAPIDLYFGTEYEKVIEKQIYSTVMRACRKARFLLLRKVYQKGDRLLFSAFEKSYNERDRLPIRTLVGYTCRVK